MLPTLVDSIYKESSDPLKKMLQAIDGITVSAFGITIKASNTQNDPRQYQNLLEEFLKQLIIAPRRGYLKFSLPFFKDFLEEVQYLY